MGHPQPPTPIATDNTTAVGIVHDTIKQVRSRTMDMRFHLVRDRMLQGQFHIYWDKGENNFGDCFIKHHPPHHQYQMRPKVLNNPPGTKYYSGKGVLVVPRRGPKPRPKITAGTVNPAVRNRPSITAKAVINQSKVFESQMTKLRSLLIPNRILQPLI